MIGSGKTTTAGHLADWLLCRGEDVRVFDEGAADHPIRTRRVDELLAAPAPGDPGAYSAGQWRRLAERCLRDGQTIILESVFLQNSVMPAFIDGAPAAGRRRGRGRARAPDPRRAVVLAERGLRAGLPMGPPPEPARPRRRRPAVPSLGARGGQLVRPLPVPQAHGPRPAARLAVRPEGHLRRRPTVTALCTIRAAVRP